MRLENFCMGTTAFLLAVSGSAIASPSEQAAEASLNFPLITMISLLISLVFALCWLIEKAQSGGSVMSFFLPALLLAIHAGIFGIGLILGDWSMFNISLFLISSIATAALSLLGYTLSCDQKL